MRTLLNTIFTILIGLFLLASITPTCTSFATEEPAANEQVFPGLNEVVPRATGVAAQLDAAVGQIALTEELSTVLSALKSQSEEIETLETNYSNWAEIKTWHLNRLMGAESGYADLQERMQKPLESISQSLQSLEILRQSWQEEKNFWQEWRTELKNQGINYPAETFARTLANIDSLLTRITRAAEQLVDVQQKHSPLLELIASRLNLIGSTLDVLRDDILQRNAYSLLEADYYRQYNKLLLNDFIGDLLPNLRLPETFFKRYSAINTLYSISILTILALFLYRKHQVKPVAEEWQFLLNRPISGAIFISATVLTLLKDFYANAPPLWSLLFMGTVTIAAIRLLSAIYRQRFSRYFVRVIAALYITTTALLVFGLPTPLLQLYQITLCGTALPLCLFLLRRKSSQLSQWQKIGLLLISLVAAFGLTSSFFGFEALTSTLIDATLGTFILMILVQMALRLINGGVQTFMALSCIRQSEFIQQLGIDQATQKLKTLLRIILLVNAVLYLLVTWNIFDQVADAQTSLLNFEYTIGELTISVQMVILVVIVLYLTSLFSWIIQAFLDSQIMTPRHMDRGVKESLKRLTHYGLFTVGFLVAVSMAGLDLQKFTILAGALGVGIGFGLQNIVNNFVSGLILLFERPVKVGDIINIGTEWGTITKIGLRSTVFETFDHSEIIVPNADLISQNVTNWTFSSKMVRINLPVGVAYGSPLEKVLKILTRAAHEHQKVLSHPAPDAVFIGFGSSSIDFNLRFWVNSIDDRLTVQTEVAVIIDRLFREEDITIPFPQQDLHLRSVEEDLQHLFGKEHTAEDTKQPSTTDDEKGTPV